MNVLIRRIPSYAVRGAGGWKSSTLPAGATYFSSEESIREKLVSSLQATFAEVEDISGGCGSMYKLEVESELFRGVSMVKQHQMVTNSLKDEIKEMHGLTIKTRQPKA